MLSPESPLYVAKVHAGVLVTSALCPFAMALTAGLAALLVRSLAVGATNRVQYIVRGFGLEQP